MNSVSTTIYVNSDVLILGFLTSNTYSGLYAVSARVYSIVKNVIAAVITVSIPRLSAYWATGDVKKIENTCHRIFAILLIFAAPAMVGLFSLSRQVVLLISGPDFENAYVSLAILSIALLVAIICWFYKSCVLVPAKHEKEAMKGTIAAALVNIVLNFILIPFFQEKAAAFTTLIAESVSLTIAFIASRKVLKVHLDKRNIVSVVIGSVVILAICICAQLIPKEKYALIIATAIPASDISYGLILIVSKNKYAMEILYAVFRKLGIKK